MCKEHRMQMQIFLVFWLNPGTGSRILVMSNRFYLKCGDQIIGSDCPTGYSEKNWEPLSELNRKECNDRLVMSDTGTGMRRDGTDARAEALQFLFTRTY